MNQEEITALLNYAAALDGRIARMLAEYEPAALLIDRWTRALPDIPTTTPEGAWDVAHVVRRYYDQSNGEDTARYHPIEPHHLLAAWTTHRRDQLDRHTDPLPHTHPDNETAWRTELAATRHAVATGHQPPTPHNLPEDQNQQHRRPLPPEIADLLTAYRRRNPKTNKKRPKPSQGKHDVSKGPSDALRS